MNYKLSKEQVNKELTSIFGQQDNEDCFNSIYAHECRYCDFAETCWAYGVPWLFNKYKVLDSGSLIIYKREDEEDGNN